jgi:ABC-type spermidine/putrescine transport system permease subunit I
MNKNMVKRILPYIFVMPAFCLIMAVVAYPIVTTLIRSFSTPDNQFTIENYTYFFTNKNAFADLTFTLYVVVMTVVLAIVFSYMLALYLRFSNSRISKIISGLYLLPRFIPSLVAVYAMIAVVRDSGLINRISQLMGHNYKLGLMYTAKGVIMMNLWFNIPFATMIIVSALSGIPDSIIESARDVGAKKLEVFRTMILPLSLKDVLIAATFVFMGNVGSFTTPYLMGPNRPQMLGTALFKQFSSYADYEKAAALSVIMFLTCSVSAAIYISTNLKEKDWEKTGW